MGIAILAPPHALNIHRISLAKPCRQTPVSALQPPCSAAGRGLTGTPPSLGEARGPPPEGLLHSGELGLIGCQPCQLLPPYFPSRVKPARPKHQDLVQILALSERLESRQATHAWVIKSLWSCDLSPNLAVPQNTSSDPHLPRSLCRDARGVDAGGHCWLSGGPVQRGL